jgi:hypothetical protein
MATVGIQHIVLGSRTVFINCIHHSADTYKYLGEVKHAWDRAGSYFDRILDMGIIGFTMLKRFIKILTAYSTTRLIALDSRCEKYLVVNSTHIHPRTETILSIRAYIRVIQSHLSLLEF